MTDRAVPKPDQYASCPFDGNVLEYYAGTFDAVYVSLSPFIRPVKISPSLFDADTYPRRGTVKTSCEPVPWRDVVAQTNISSLSDVDVGLRTQISGLTSKFENQTFANELDKLAKSTGIIPPPEGSHSDLLHDLVLGIFKELGHEWVWIGDEFCTERKLHWIDDLMNEDDDVPAIGKHCNVFAPDKSILWTVHWDSHFSFLASSVEILDRIGIDKRLEGFYCTSETEVFWSAKERHNNT